MTTKNLSLYIEEIARARASIDGKAGNFDACKADPSLEETFGCYEGYITEAEALLKRSPMSLHAIITAANGPAFASPPFKPSSPPPE